MRTGCTLFILTLLFAFNSARADLVWTKDRGWQIQGGVLANVFGDAEKVGNALEAMNAAKAAQDEGEYRRAVAYYNIIVSEYPESPRFGAKL